MSKYYSMPTKITKPKKKERKKIGQAGTSALSNRSDSLTCPKTWAKGFK